MRKWTHLLSAAALALLAAPSHAVLLPASATFSLELGTFPPVSLTVAGNLNATTSGGAVTGFTVPASLVSTSVVQPVAPPVVLLPGISLTNVTIAAANATGNFAQTGMSSGTGVMGLTGAATLIIQAYGGPNPAVLPLTGAFGVPGGKVTSKVLNLVPVTILANGWTLGTVMAVTTPLGGTAMATPTRMGSHSTSTVATGGPSANIVKNTNLNYVTATQIIITGVGNIASFGTLSVQLQQVVGHVVPEPGTLLLLGSGLAGLGLLGRRMRKA